jgi:hypothetical protein
MRLFLIFTSALFVLIFHSSALLADGVLNAVSYQVLPANISIVVEPLDDSDSNLEIKSEIESALRARGINVSNDGAYVLSFEIRDRLGMLSEAGNRYLFKFETSGGRGGGENTEARLNVYDSHHGGLLNKGVGSSRVSRPTIYRLEAGIEKRQSGKRIWEAWAEAQLTGGDSRDLTRRMVPAIVKNIGKTAKQLEFPLY